MKISKKILIILAILLASIISGCTYDIQKSENQNEIVLSSPDGKIYDKVSDNFIFVVYPTKLIVDEGRKNILYDIEVRNNSNVDYKKLSVSIVMNSELDQYIAAGVAPLEFTGVDVASKSKSILQPGECRGITLKFQQLLSDDQFMKEAGLEYKDIEKLAEEFEIVVKWDGGSESYKFTNVVKNELN